MSKVTTIYDAINTRLAALFPNKQQLFNPYIIEDNPYFVLIDGYGVAVSGSEAPNLQFNTVSQNRAFDITLSTEVVKTDENVTITDTQTKGLLEDLNSMLLDFCNPDQLGIELSIDGIEIGSCSRVEFLEGESEKILYITQTINIIWQENI